MGYVDQFQGRLPGPHDYAGMGLKIFPLGRCKAPLISKGQGGRGYLGETDDRDQIDACLKLNPPHWAFATGEVSGTVVVDFDLAEVTAAKPKPGDTLIVWGVDSLEVAGIPPLAATTPTIHTPRGGIHQWFRWPGVKVISMSPLWLAGKPVPGVDIKADGGSCTLPPGPNRWWDSDPRSPDGAGALAMVGYPISRRARSQSAIPIAPATVKSRWTMK